MYRTGYRFGMSAIERKNFKLNFKIENKVFSGKKHEENRSGFCFGLEKSERYF